MEDLEAFFAYWMLSFQVLSVVPAGQVATVGHKDEQLFTALAAAAERRMRDFDSQNLANTAWAFATVVHKGNQLFTALAAAAERCVRDFNSQDLANRNSSRAPVLQLLML